jgi:kynureninase
MIESGAALDRLDPLSSYRSRFVDAPGVIAYLDGNSLGRPLTATAQRVERFVREEWGGRLIRGWDEGWLELPLTLGDELGRVALGAAQGQVVIGDSTTVMLYKLVRAALDARPGRTEIVIDRDNFPTDRYVVEGIAADRGLTIRWIDTDAIGGVTRDLAAMRLGPNTALTVFSSVAYRSGYIADVRAITSLAHAAGALALWDLSHSTGSVVTELDAWGVDLAVGCGYKYLSGGPGAPAHAYVRTELQASIRQPIQGWLGSANPFDMPQGYVPAEGMRGYLSGTPPIMSMLAMKDMIALIDEVGMPAIRAKSQALTDFAVVLVEELLPDVRISSPYDPERRGSHITIDHPGFAELVPRLREAGVVPDFRGPTGIRLGLSPLSTSFAEVEEGVRAIAAMMS